MTPHKFKGFIHNLKMCFFGGPKPSKDWYFRNLRQYFDIYWNADNQNKKRNRNKNETETNKQASKHADTFSNKQISKQTDKDLTRSVMVW